MNQRRLWVELLMLAVSLLFVLPFVFMVLATFKSESEILAFDSLWPRRFSTANYEAILENTEEAPVLQWLMNSLFISASVTVLVVTVSSLAAYGLARLRPPGGGLVFGLVVATMMVPGQVFLVPVYLMLNALGWLDTPAALIFPPAAGAFGTFLLHQFFKRIPRELEEAATVDGCSSLGVFWHVVLPTSWPALATLGIFTFVGSWNDFMGPLVFLDSVDQFTLPVGIALFQTSYYAEYGLTLAASMIATLPVVVVFVIFQRHIIESIALTGLKE